MRKLVFSGRAEEDLFAIFDYTAEKWGKVQAEKYTRELHQACVRFAESSTIAAPHRAVPAPYQSKIAGKHIAIFYVHDDKAEVLAILHQSMDIPSRVAEMLKGNP